ncbi:MAG TPA: hypothetical protein VKU00_26290 [Chthonomonadaceae bacterium]|nr:hypothetical protein [Chthonomonadaceae bacterium]
MRGVRHKWLRTLFLSGMSLIVLAFLVLDPILRAWVKHDQAGAKPQHGMATVEILVMPPPNSIGMDVLPQVSVRFQGHLCSVKTVQDAPDLHLGQPALIEYRVGKSGRIYVDSAAPLPPPTADAPASAMPH